MTAEQRVADDLHEQAKQAEEARVAELARRKKRDEARGQVRGARPSRAAAASSARLPQERGVMAPPRASARAVAGAREIERVLGGRFGERGG